MFEFSEWAALALESGRFTEAGYGNDGKWERSTVHSRSANSGEEMENLSRVGRRYCKLAFLA